MTGHCGTRRRYISILNRPKYCMVLLQYFGWDLRNQKLQQQPLAQQISQQLDSIPHDFVVSGVSHRQMKLHVGFNWR